MFKIAGILIKDRVRRMKKTIECHKILMFFAVVGLISCIYTTSLQDILFLKKYLIYVTWSGTRYDPAEIRQRQDHPREHHEQQLRHRAKSPRTDAE